MATPEEKRPASEIKIQKNRFLLWLENYWYHYKWHTIIALFFVITLVVCLVQCAKREEPDLLVAMAGDVSLSQEAQEALSAALQTVAPAKKSGAGKQSVKLSQYTIFSPDQIKARSLDEKGNFSPSTSSAIASSSQAAYSSFTVLRSAGETSLYLVSDYVYESFHMQDYAVPLSELFDSIPASSIDGCSVRFSELEFARYYSACKALPTDLRLVFVKPLVVGKSNDEAVYNAFRDLFVAILSFREP